VSLLNIRDKFRGPAASIDEQIESFAIERVPASQRWPIPAISLVLLGNATAMFFFSFGAQQAFLVGWPWLLLPIGYFFFGAVLIGMLTMRVASHEGLSQNLLSRGLRGHLVHLRGELHLLLLVRGHDRFPRDSHLLRGPD
jgi:cytosine permease